MRGLALKLEQADDSLEALAHRAARGDREAFAELAARIRGTVYRWALVRTGDADDADDVTQSVMVRVHRHLPGWQGSGRFTSWLYRVTANAAASHLTGSPPTASAARASAGLEDMTRGGDASPIPPDPAERAVARVYAEGVSDLVRTFFDELPPRQREVFDLVELQGLAPAEVADLLEMNGNTVRAHLFKARTTIRRRILARHPELERGYTR